MKPTIKQPSNSQSAVDRKLLLLLRRNGAQTIESLTLRTGIGWGQVFLSVDRLSRTGKVSLTPVYPSAYRVSVGRVVHQSYPARDPSVHTTAAKICCRIGWGLLWATRRPISTTISPRASLRFDPHPFTMTSLRGARNILQASRSSYASQFAADVKRGKGWCEKSPTRSS